MNIVILTLITFAGIISILAFQKNRKKQHRQNLIREPFSESWASILENYYPLYKILPENLKKQLHGHIQIFIDEKTFEGQAGLSITDEIRLIIAAQACILLLNRKTD